MHLINEGNSVYLIETEDPSMEDLLAAGVPDGTAERALDEIAGRAPASLVDSGFGPSD